MRTRVLSIVYARASVCVLVRACDRARFYALALAHARGYVRFRVLVRARAIVCARRKRRATHTSLSSSRTTSG